MAVRHDPSRSLVRLVAMYSADSDDLFLAKLAEQVERYDDMTNQMKKVVEAKAGALSMEERNILSVAYKSVVGQRRASLRCLKAAEQTEVEKRTNNQRHAKAYREKVEMELHNLCASIIELLEGLLIPKAENAEAKVFFLKMKGDYNRYRAEVSSGDDNVAFVGLASGAYDEAKSQAIESLTTTHPVRLGLALNHSVFKYEVEKKQEEACEIAKVAFDDAIADLDSIDQDTYKDATMIMQMLKDNLSIWQPEDD